MPKVVLSNMLYVPQYLVSNKMKDAFTYKTSERVFTRKQILNRCCGECRWFNKCENPKSTNPGNVCSKFEAPVILEWKTMLLKTYSQLDDGTYAFNRGDFKKIKELFGHLEFDDQRKYPSLGMNGLKFTSKLYDDQQRTANDWLRHGYGTVKCPTAWGKCICGNTLVPTSNGLFYIKDLVKNPINKQVTPNYGKTSYFNENSNIKYGYYEKNVNVINIKTKWGYEITCTPDHKLLTIDNNGIKWEEVKNLNNNSYIAIQSFKLNNYNNFILKNTENINITIAGKKHPKPLNVPSQITPKLARLLGHLTADGSLTIKRTIKYTKADKINVQDVKNCLKELNRTLKQQKNKIEYIIDNATPLKNLLDILEMKCVKASQKTIPYSILQSNKNIIANFLKAYFSGDGDVDINPSVQVFCSSASKQLIKEIQILLLGFNIFSNIRIKNVKLPNKNEYKNYYILTISRLFIEKFNDEIGFLLNSKKDKKLKKAIQYYKNIKQNQNIYTVPVNNLIKKLYKRLVYEGGHQIYTRLRENNLNHLVERNSKPSLQTLKLFLDTLNDVNHYKEWKEINNIYNLYTNEGIWFSQIKNIKNEDKKDVYDITIPEKSYFIGNGIVSHNSVLLAWLILHLNLKTIILTQEVRHLLVMWDAFREHTNITEIEEKLGEPLIGRLAHENRGTVTVPKFSKTKKAKDKIYPITLSTFQSLSRKGGLILLDKIKDSFGFLALEEAHHEAAWTFHKVTQSFNTWYRYGQTATPTRKDQKHKAIYDTIGPVTAIGKTEQMTPRVTFIHTGIDVPNWVFLGQHPHSRLEKWLANSFEYQKIVCEQLLQDIKEGRKVFVYTKRRTNATWLERQVTLSGYNAKVIMSGSKDTDQKKISELLLDDRLSCVIGTKVMKENVNIPPLDVVHLPFPNFGKENEEQIVGRIRRYIRDIKTKEILYDAKPQPLIKVYTTTADNDIPSRAFYFRKKLYKKWKFDFDEDQYIENEITKPTGKSLQELMNEENK